MITQRQMSLIKKTPNILSVIRIVLSVLLVPLAFLCISGKPNYIAFRWLFISIYLICGITDVADGKIARRFKAQTDLGAKLDSIGDVAVIVAAVCCVLLIMKILPKEPLHLIWVGAVLLLRLFNAVVAKVKFNTFNNIHTQASKLMGAVAFLCVIGFIIADDITPWVVIPGSIIAFITVLEETIILFTAKEFDVNKKGLFFKDKKPAEAGRDKE